MNVLVLSNGAPGYSGFFNGLADKLFDNGENVFFAVDSDYHAEADNLYGYSKRLYCFSEFFASHDVNNDIIEKYSDCELNFAIFSEFERGDVYNYWRYRDGYYYKKLQSALLCFFENIFRDNMIDVVVYENISNAFAYYAWFVANKFNKKFIGLIGSRIPGRYSIIDHPNYEHLIYKKIYEKIELNQISIDSEVEKWADDYMKNFDSKVPDYMKFNNLDNISISNLYFNKNKLKKILLAIKYSGGKSKYYFQTGRPIYLSWMMFRRNLLRKINVFRMNGLYDSVDRGDKYILYPLHYHPESSTSIQAAAYINEYEIIRTISFSLPAGYFLYVKDHISGFGTSSVDFYNKIKDLPNVKLLGPRENTKELIRKSCGVATLTSTVGYEALLLNKKVFLFGRVFYEFHPNVVRVDNLNELHEIIRKNINFINKNTEKINKMFLAAYYMGTFPGVLNFSLDAIGTKKLVDSVYFDIYSKISEK